MMNVLALDTASPSPAASLVADGRLFEEPLPCDRRASEELLPAIRRLLAAAGRRLEECGRLAVCSGPGSFTGVRVGLATAWSFGRSLHIPVEEVPTLEAMAETTRSDGAGRVVAALDAGRGEIVCERFSLEEPRARSLAPATRLPRDEFGRFASGDPVIAIPAHLLEAGGLTPAMCVASALAFAVARAPREGPEGGMMAVYARPSAAEEKRGAA